jgi:hypothetical protein
VLATFFVCTESALELVERQPGLHDGATSKDYYIFNANREQKVQSFALIFFAGGVSESISAPSMARGW